MNVDAFDKERGKLLVCAKRCTECLFSSAKIVDDARRDEVLASCSKTGKYFLCHKATLVGKAIVCRGFFDEFPNRACRVAALLGIVEFKETSV